MGCRCLQWGRGRTRTQESREAAGLRRGGAAGGSYMTEGPHPALPRKRGRENFVSGPDAHGRYGRYGGQFIPETLMAAVEELPAAFDAAQRDAGFRHEFDELSRTFSGRPTPVYLAERLTARAGGARIWLKREDLCPPGPHQ